jgi:gliding motility-associated-like protein
LNPVASPSVTTTYTLTVQTNAGCVASDTARVIVLPQNIAIPNTFTPNGDGINDTWDIKSLSFYANCSVAIFTRWGQKVYSSIGYSIPWDGTYKGTALPTGTYYYVIDLQNGHSPLSGFVAIIR